MTTLLAHFDGKVLVPDEPVELQPGERLKLTIERVGPQPIKPQPAREPWRPMDLKIDPAVVHAIAMDPEFDIEES